jgi:hypothetical protein
MNSSSLACQCRWLGQAQQVHAVLRQPRGIPKTRALPCPAGFVEWWWIKRAHHRFQSSDIDLLAHVCLLLMPLNKPPTAPCIRIPRTQAAMKRASGLGEFAGFRARLTFIEVPARSPAELSKL